MEGVDNGAAELLVKFGCPPRRNQRSKAENVTRHGYVREKLRAKALACQALSANQFCELMLDC
jgi:hypothetical protein